MPVLLHPLAAPDTVSIFMTTSDASFSKYDLMSRYSYEALFSSEGLSGIVTLHQVHSATILKVSSANKYVVDGSDGDGLFTAEEGLAIGILTADCYPVIVTGGRCVAALHCGWRGAVNGIIDKVRHFFEAENDKPQYAYIGAGISCDAFEVKEDFISTVSALTDSALYLVKNENRWYFDLKKFINERLREIGVKTIESVDRCTFTESAFHSYRRDGAASGRMLTGVVRRKAGFICPEVEQY